MRQLIVIQTRVPRVARCNETMTRITLHTFAITLHIAQRELFRDYIT